MKAVAEQYVEKERELTELLVKEMGGDILNMDVTTFKLLQMFAEFMDISNKLILESAGMMDEINRKVDLLTIAKGIKEES